MDIYLIFVFILFALAIADLIVGVSNDAVNFLNSAVGSKVASRAVIMIVASIGILIGAIFSNGMMEIARKGIFNPQFFMFTEIMVIFLAVMLTDVLLLDFFNTVGLPTSTTVSVVFDLLGASVAVGIMKIQSGSHYIMVDGVEKVAKLSDYINSSKALTIIGGILLSVVVAFTFGVIIQWFSRLLFTFSYKKPLKYFGAIWGGIAFALIFQYILIDAAKHVTFITSEQHAYIKENGLLVISVSFLAWTILLQLLHWIFKVNILKLVVLFGTFGLAMAFAGNDLVNFIGVPLAGFEAFKLFQSNGGNDILMEGLAGSVQTPTVFLILAGVVMVLTLWLSKKARSVTETELNLSRQDEGFERFGSSLAARLLVRRVISTTTFFDTILPDKFVEKMRKRFDQTEVNKKLKKEKNPPMFDLIRASVNLTVASILISLATSYKLPLSTTYVTFMVAMGSSLADGAWGRDSAVYRITGVFTVIGGWFLTAITAFSSAFLVAIFLMWAKFAGVIILVILALIALIRSHTIYKKKSKENEDVILSEFDNVNSAASAVAKSNKNVLHVLTEASKIYYATIQGLINENHKDLRGQYQNVKDLNVFAKKQKDNVHKIIIKLQEESVETGHYYVQVVDYLREFTHNLSFMVNPVYEYVENNHKTFTKSQLDELLDISAGVSDFAELASKLVSEKKYDKTSEMIAKQTQLLELIKDYRKNQIKRIKTKEVGTKNSMLYLSMLNETSNLLLNAVNVIKAQRDFVLDTKK